eukprot:TRINITY_DN1067_c0_g1_i3.p1 TRINITY_DN1067_c0_g1~~TRINITY_DN1067_c0_g1_i3.p1  ORF type:complete len:652 (+),score=95.02 TRINITY_DN1067_c0_g1_i3:292-2247(+)
MLKIEEKKLLELYFEDRKAVPPPHVGMKEKGVLFMQRLQEELGFESEDTVRLLAVGHEMRIHHEVQKFVYRKEYETGCRAGQQVVAYNLNRGMQEKAMKLSTLKEQERKLTDELSKLKTKFKENGENPNSHGIREAWATYNEKVPKHVKKLFGHLTLLDADFCSAFNAYEGNLKQHIEQILTVWERWIKDLNTFVKQGLATAESQTASLKAFEAEIDQLRSDDDKSIQELLSRAPEVVKKELNEIDTHYPRDQLKDVVREKRGLFQNTSKKLEDIVNTMKKVEDGAKKAALANTAKRLSELECSVREVPSSETGGKKKAQTSENIDAEALDKRVENLLNYIKNKADKHSEELIARIRAVQASMKTEIVLSTTKSLRNLNLQLPEAMQKEYGKLAKEALEIDKKTVLDLGVRELAEVVKQHCDKFLKAVDEASEESLERIIWTMKANGDADAKKQSYVSLRFVKRKVHDVLRSYESGMRNIENERNNVLVPCETIKAKFADLIETQRKIAKLEADIADDKVKLTQYSTFVFSFMETKEAEKGETVRVVVDTTSKESKNKTAPEGRLRLPGEFLSTSKEALDLLYQNYWLMGDFKGLVDKNGKLVLDRKYFLVFKFISGWAKHNCGCEKKGNNTGEKGNNTGDSELTTTYSFG